MALEQRQFLKMGQALVMTPQLRQAIKILQVSRLELEQLVDQEMSENPLLEEEIEPAQELDQEKPRTEEQLEEKGSEEEIWNEPTAERESSTELEADPDKSLKEIDWKEYLENYSNDWHASSSTPADSDDEKRPTIENTLVRAESLSDHLLWQLQMNQLEEEEEEVVAQLLGNMDADGYIMQAVEDIAFQRDCDYDLVENALRRIQELDPPGVGARDLRECLLLQLRANGGAGSLAERIVRDHLSNLEGKRYDKIAKELATTVEDVAAAAALIANLEPKPGRNFGDGDVRYITPDASVQKVGDEYVVTMNDEGLPRLRVSSYYRRVLGSPDSGDAKRYIQEKMRAAQWLIKSIQQRQRTLFLVITSIVKFQRDFLDHGISHLKPLVLKNVADDIGMHESTVSRATANKYVHTPQGILELKFFFTSSLKSGDGGEDVSAESVKERIRAIVETEDPRKPFSDQYIAEMLEKENIDIARRTVAKYREMMGILPSAKRRRVC